MALGLYADSSCDESKEHSLEHSCGVLKVGEDVIQLDETPSNEGFLWAGEIYLKYGHSYRDAIGFLIVIYLEEVHSRPLGHCTS